jgi:hypothetical protein
MPPKKIRREKAVNTSDRAPAAQVTGAIDPDPSIPGLGKVSNLLTVVIKPFVEGVETLSDFKSVVATACIAWNTSTLPQSEWAFKISAIVNEMSDMPEDLREGLMLVILKLIERKLELFPNDTRLIMGYSVTRVKGQFQIAVETVPVEQKA